MTARPSHARAWTEFWREQSRAAPCCANDPDILNPLRDHWRSFARKLKPGARVLDLGCGSGAVGRALVEASPALRITGVDFAAVPPSGDSRIAIHPGIAMERLPFADASFDAAVSQFGFEYSRVEQTARELGRVIRPGGAVSLLVHHRHSRIVADSHAHHRALTTICGPSIEAAFLGGDRAALAALFGELRRRSPGERLVEQAALGLIRHSGLPPPQRERIWRQLTEALAPELVMLASLDRAAVSAGGVSPWLAPLIVGFTLEPPTVLTSVRFPLCWLIVGERRRSH